MNFFLLPQHESEILPFPNSEKSFVLPEEIIQDVKEGEPLVVSLRLMRLIWLIYLKALFVSVQVKWDLKTKWRRSSKKSVTHPRPMKKVLFSFTLSFIFLSTHPFLFPFPLSLFLFDESRLLKPASLHHFFLSGSFSRWREAQRGSHWSFVSHFQRSGSQYGWPGFCEVWTEENVSLCSKAPAWAQYRPAHYQRPL